jgi:uncharacterized protein
MTYLLDVNVLVALALVQHEFHARAARWMLTLESEKAALATCSLTELAFIRLLAQVPQYRFNVSDATELLIRVKQTSKVPFTFIPDAHDCTHLPGWVKSPKQITDGHLAGLAKRNGAIFATLDLHIRDAFLLPHS